MDAMSATRGARAGEGSIDGEQLRAAMRGALDRGEFRVYYQPIVGFDPAEVCGFEALLRWEHPEYGVLAPAQFLAIAEDNGLIVPIGAAVLEAACLQAAQWATESVDGRTLTISVNLSARQLLAHDLLGAVVHALASADLPAELLVLEMSEAALLEVGPRCTTVLADLSDLGVQLCVDDFGAHHTSLHMLQATPLSELKLDRSFVTRATASTAPPAMAAAVVAFAHALGISVTAQGVDSGSEFADVRAIGCDRGQGRYFALPQPGAVVQALVHHRFRWREQHSAA